MKKSLVLMGIVTATCVHVYADGPENGTLISAIQSKNILAAIKDAARTQEYKRANARVQDEAKKANTVLFNKMRERLSPEERAYTATILLAVQDFQVRMASLVDVVSNLPAEQRTHKMALEVVGMQADALRIKELIEPFAQAHEVRSAEEKADFEAWGLEIMTLVANSLKQFTDTGLSVLNPK